MNGRVRFSVQALLVLCVLSGGGIVAPRAAAAAGQDEVDVLICFDHAPNKTDVALMQRFGGRLKRSYRTFPIVAARLPEWAVLGLSKRQGVLRIEPDLEIKLHSDELEETWGVERIGSGDAHANGHSGAGVRVAVIDTGIDYTHPDLSGRYAGGYDFVNNDNDPFDDNGHGTHVAGTIAAIADGVGVVGVAPDVQLYGLKVLGANGSGSFSSVIAAVDWCIANDIQITNSSYGSQSYPGSLVEAAFSIAADAGILHVGSAGNSGNSEGTGNSVGYPGGFDSVIAVAATRRSEARAGFSSTGPQVELAAPGVSIPSTLPGGTYAYYSGTSMASPHVAGAAALLVAAGMTDDDGNGLISDDVRELLQATALDLGSSGRDQQYGFGRIDVALALTLVPDATAPEEAPETEEPEAAPPLINVNSIDYLVRGAQNQNLVVRLTVMDRSDVPVENAIVAVDLTNNKNEEVISQIGVTNSKGVVRFRVLNAIRGRWRTRVVDVAADGFEWDGIYPRTSFRMR